MDTPHRRMHRLRRAALAALFLTGSLASAGLIAPTALRAEPGGQLDRFYAGTPNSPTYPLPGGERNPLQAQLQSPGGSGAISSYGMGAGTGNAPTTGISPTVANPFISAILNGYYSDFSKQGDFKVPGFALGPDVDAGKPGFHLSETEVGIYGNVDPYLYGSVVLSFPAEGSVAVEEAFVQTTALPYGLIAKAGRFHSSIGYLNVFHRHADDFIDTPLVYSAFLNGQLADDGLQLRWVAPVDVLLEVGAEFLNGSTWPSAGSNNAGKGTNTQFVHLADDIGEGGSYLLGLSHVDSSATKRVTAGNADSGTNGLSFTGTNTLNIASLVYKWSPLGNAKYTLFKFQGEYFEGDEHGTYTVIDSSGATVLDGNGDPTTIDLRGSRGVKRTGWYAQALYKFKERWRIGLRQSEVTSDRIADPNAVGTNLDTQGHTPAITSAMVEFWPSEFSQFRLQYSNDQTQRTSVDRWYLQYIITLGAHAAHTY